MASNGPTQAGGADAPYAELWGDVVDRSHLIKAIGIGALVSVAVYFIAGALLQNVAPTPALARAYAMLAGMGGCIAGGAICARLFAPKRIVSEEATDAAWRERAIEELLRDSGGATSVADLPPAVVAEMKELGLYDAFAAHERKEA